MNIAKLYYVDFDAESSAPVRLATFRNRYSQFAVNKIPAKERSFLVAYLTGNRLCAGKFDEGYLRMVVELTDGRTILVDGDGCVKFGGKEYFIRPGAFLQVFKIMSGITFQQKGE